MKLKKKIIRQSFDYGSEKAYYCEAKVCPNCGNRQEFENLHEEIMATSRGTLTITTARIESGYAYECKKCGCQWEVPRFKG